MVNKKGVTMKKGGLGSIPKILSWIDDLESTPQTTTAKEEITAQSKPNKEVIPQKIVKENSVPKVTKSTQKGLAKGWTRATFIVDEEINEKIKALAYWDRVTVKEIVHSALTKHLQGRNIKPIPKKSTL